jgi:predicted hydrocarbon binding protein
MSVTDAQLMRPYFLRDDYIKGSPFEGTLKTNMGQRVIVLPEELLQGLHNAIVHETGRAWGVVAYTCGRKWGERLVKSWQKEWTHYYQQEVLSADFIYFEQWARAAFSFYGWGELELDFSLQDQGVVQCYLKGSVLARLLGDLEDKRVCHIFAGMFAAMFTRLAGRELDALEIACSRSGAERCRFVVALPEFIERARKAQLDDQDVDAVMAALLK